jgi:SAM-dependent methyltransferase
MPGIDENRATWSARSSWAARGDEWSGAWGGTELLWQGTLLPRLHAFLPAETVLELGPGHGRWTHYLKDLCDELVLVDVAESCIDACRERFGDELHIRYHVNDGKSLAMVPDRALDLVFSFDSLVHAEHDVLEAYLHQLADKLKPDGIGFVHHSNMGSYRAAAALARHVPDRLRRALTRHRLLVDVYAWRAESTTAESFATLCERTGLACVGQEKIPWQYGRGLTDVLSLFTPRGSRWERPNVVVDNRGFMEEAGRLAQVARLYGRAAFPRAATRASSST